MSNRSTIVWGIIGCGDVAEIKSGPAFQKCDNSELLAVMRRNGDLAEDFAKRHGLDGSDFYITAPAPCPYNHRLPKIFIRDTLI